MRPVNLLPETQRPVRASGAQGGSAYIVLGVLGAILLGTLLYVLTVNGIASKEEQIAEVEREAAVVETAAATLRPFGSFAEISRLRVASVRGLATARVDWERLLREISLVLPRRAYVNQLQASAAAPAETAATAAAAVPTPTATVTGCAARHRDVATAVVRFEQMHRVIDATLVESTRATGANEPGDCGGYAFTVGLTMDPVVPAEAPRGHTSVPAKLGGGS